MLSTLSYDWIRRRLPCRRGMSLVFATLTCLGVGTALAFPFAFAARGDQAETCGGFSQVLSIQGSLDATGVCAGAPRGCSPMPSLLTRRNALKWHIAGPTQIANTHSPADCRTVDTFPEEAFFRSGAFTSDGSSLVLVDSANRTTLVYDQRGRYQGSMPDLIDIGTVTGGFRAIQGSDGVLWAQYGEGTLVALDNSFRPQETVDISHPRDRGRKIGVALKSWTPSSNFSILGCADLQLDENSWEGAVVVLSLQDSSIQVIDRAPYSFPRWSYCALALPLFAFIGDQAYQFDWWNEAGILKITQPSDAYVPLGNFPAKLKQMPKLPPISSRSDYVRAYAVIEKSSMVTGLFSWEGSLFILSKEWRADQRQWSIFDVDPNDGSIRYEWKIQSAAAHLSVVPGKINWAIIETAPLVEYLRQPITSIKLIDSAVFRTPARRVERQEPITLCPEGITDTSRRPALAVRNQVR